MDKKSYFPLIDLLRGFAAISVVVYHVIEHFNWKEFPVSGPLLWFRIGWIGVDLFFVISGFVISLSAFSLLDRLDGRRFIESFIKRRVARILPLHYLTCLFFLAIVAPEIILQANFIGNAISHLGFFHNLSWRFHGAINGPNWSIGVEMQFYLLVVILAPIMRTCRWWLIPLVAFPLAWGWRYSVFNIVPIDTTVGPFYRFWACTQLPGTLDQFAVGVVLARLMRSRRAAYIPDFLARKPYVIAVASALAVWLMLELYWPQASFWDHAAMVVIWRSLAAVSLGLVVLFACSIRSVSVIAATTPLRYLGTISYGIYLWHLAIIIAVKRIEGIAHGTALALVVLLSIILASVSWHFFEKPFVSKGSPNPKAT